MRIVVVLCLALYLVTSFMACGVVDISKVEGRDRP